MTEHKPSEEGEDQPKRGRPEDSLVIPGVWEEAVQKALKVPPIPKAITPTPTKKPPKPKKG